MTARLVDRVLSVGADPRDTSDARFRKRLLVVVLSEVVRPDGADLPVAFVRTFAVLNIVLVSFVGMVLLVTFARGRDIAQARVEALLLNVLPAEVAERLQSDPNSIADHFEEASILFADVVNFTPLPGRLDAREVGPLRDRAARARERQGEG